MNINLYPYNLYPPQLHTPLTGKFIWNRLTQIFLTVSVPHWHFLNDSVLTILILLSLLWSSWRFYPRNDEYIGVNTHRLLHSCQLASTIQRPVFNSGILRGRTRWRQRRQRSTDRCRLRITIELGVNLTSRVHCHRRVDEVTVICLWVFRRSAVHQAMLQTVVLQLQLSSLGAVGIVTLHHLVVSVVEVRWHHTLVDANGWVRRRKVWRLEVRDGRGDEGERRPMIVGGWGCRHG